MINRCLGKLPASADVRRLMYASYKTDILPPPPATSDRTYGLTEWGVMANDRLGDCAYAAPGHMVMAWSKGAAGKPVIIPDAEIVAAYSAGTGYNPATGANDNGASMMNVCDQWRTAGIGGNKIVASAGLDTRDPNHFKEVIYYYGGVYAGVSLPQSAIQQTDANLVWTRPWFSPIAGGHAICLLSYDERYVWCVSWGKVQCMTWEFLLWACDEAYACVDPLWIKADGDSPPGLKLPALVADLGVVARKAPAPPLAA